MKEQDNLKNIIFYKLLSKKGGKNRLKEYYRLISLQSTVYDILKRLSRGKGDGE